MLCPRCTGPLEANQHSCFRCGFAILPPEERVAQEPQIRPEESLLRHRHHPSFPPPPLEFVTPPSSRLNADDARGNTVLSAGTLLCRGRYRLAEEYLHQQWGNDIYEKHWHAIDVHRQDAPVVIYEMELSAMHFAGRQASLRTAMKALSSLSKHPRAPTLIDVFRDNGRDYFVFMVRVGESLLARMQRTGHLLQEQEAIECCLQIAEVLEAISHYEPAVIHGLISPEHILCVRDDQWVLTDFSLVLASRADDLPHLAPSLLPPFGAPELIEGMIDQRSDLYSLLATMYYGVTALSPKEYLRRTSLSSSLATIFARGLQMAVSQRYQQPSALYRDLLMLRPTIRASSLSGSRQNRRMSITPAPALVGEHYINNTPAPLRRPEEQDTVAMSWNSQAQLPFVPATPDGPFSIAQGPLSFPRSQEPEGSAEERLPRPEELPQMRPGNDLMAATCWLIVILLCVLIPVLLK